MLETLTSEVYAQLREDATVASTWDQMNALSSQGLGFLGDAVSAWHKGTLLGAGGLVYPWEGLAIAWLVVTKEAAPYPQATHRAVRSFLLDRVAKHGLWRIEATTRYENQMHQKFLLVLGFRAESLKYAYYPDRTNALLFVWSEGKV